MNRRFPIVPFEPARFAPFFGPAVTNLDVKLLKGGACNTNYLVTRKGKERFVCRIHQRGDPEVELRITKLAKEVVPAVEYLWVGNGVSVMTYIEGEHFAPTEALMREAGRVLAKLSTVSFARSGEIRADGSIASIEGWNSFRTGILSLLAHRKVEEILTKRVIDELEKVIDSSLDSFAEFDAARNLVHGDFRPDNILVSEGCIAGILDWEFSHSGSSFMDIGNLLRHFPSTFDDSLAKGLMEEGFELTENWRHQADLIDLISHLELLTSTRSSGTKRECISRIERFIQSTEQIRLKSVSRVSARRSLKKL